MKRNTNISFTNIFLIVFSLAIVVSGLIKRETSRKQGLKLMKGHKIASGKIKDFGVSSGRGGYPAEFTFRTEGKRYVVTLSKYVFCKKYSSREKYEIHQTEFPVVYNPSNPKISRILLRGKDYQKYNVPMPDTLKPVIKKYFDCN